LHQSGRKNRKRFQFGEKKGKSEKEEKERESLPVKSLGQSGVRSYGTIIMTGWTTEFRISTAGGRGLKSPAEGDEKSAVFHPEPCGAEVNSAG